MITVADFAAACVTLDHNDIYEMFEDDISEELRDKIYAYSEADCNEPVRNAFEKIGKEYNVQSLIDY
jgi:hypothetical protein